MVTVVLLAEDTRETATTIKTRRSRLAKVLRGALNAKRSAGQTLSQMRSAGHAAEYGKDAGVPKSMRRLQTLSQRHDSLKARHGKALRVWAKASNYQISKHSSSAGAWSRPSLDTPTRPANPNTYGRCKKSNLIRGGTDHMTRNKP